MLEKAKVSFFLASRTITRGNKGITIFTVIVLTLIFVQLVLFSSMLAGVTLKFNELMVDFQTGNVVVEPKEEERYIEDASALQKKIESLPPGDRDLSSPEDLGELPLQGKRDGSHGLRD